MLVFINGGKKDQVEWFKQSAYFNDPRTMLMLVGGSYYDLMRDMKRPVFYATKKIVQRLQLRAVPCVAVQKGVVMEIHEYDSRRLKEKIAMKIKALLLCLVLAVSLLCRPSPTAYALQACL
jgi:hypothetical protein